MRKLIFPLILAASLGATAASATTSYGTIEAINAPRLAVTLSDGVTYTFDADSVAADRLDNFKVGDEVSINWITVGTAHEGRAISPAN
jgi:ribosomal protein S1